MPLFKKTKSSLANLIRFFVSDSSLSKNVTVNTNLSMSSS